MDPDLGILSPSFFGHWSSSSRRKLWTGVPAVGAVLSVWCPSQCGCNLVSISICPVLSTYPVCIQFVACLVYHSQWDVTSDLASLHQLGKIIQSEEVRFFLRTGVRDIFWRVCLATLDRYSGSPHQEVSTLGWLIDALGTDVSVVSISGGSTILVKAFWAVGIVRSYLTTQVLIFACPSVVCNGQLPDFSGVWTDL